jgi:hypothetical protein
MAVVIRIRRATSIEWESSTRILQVAELALDTTLNKLKVGDGTKTFSQLPYLNVLPSEISEVIQDNIATFILGGEGLETSYQDNGAGSGTLTISVDETIANKEYVDDAVSSLGNSVGTSYVPITQKGNPDGVATLDPDGFIPDGEIPLSISRASDLSSHASDTTGIHGIADTSVLLTTAGGTLTGALTLPADPTDALQAATKQYVDAVSEGLHVHASCVAATTSNISLATEVESGDTLDGIVLATGNRILVKNQTTKSENGIYTVSETGAPVRALDFDSPSEIDGGDFVFVISGTLNKNTGWVQTNTVGAIGSSPIEFTQFSGIGTYTAGSGLSLTGNQFSADATIARLESPTFTGTVGGISKSMVGLANVDNTSDANKPVSNATQIELNKKTDELYEYVPWTTTAKTANSTNDKYKMVSFTSNSPIVLTLPNSTTDAGWEVGSYFEIRQMGDGQITVQAESPAVLLATEDQVKTRVKYSSLIIEKVTATTWILAGDTIA